MKTNYGFNARLNQLNMKVKNTLLMRAFAEGEPPATPPTPPAPPAPPVNFEDLVSKARKEEKDKLYPQIEALKKEVGTLTEKNNTLMLSVEAEKQAKEKALSDLVEAKKGAKNTDNEEIAELQKEIKALNKQLKDAEKEKSDLQAIEEKVKAEYDVKLYREQKLREASTTNVGIIEELVTGTTREEIDGAFAVAVQKYEAIQKRVLGGVQLPSANPNTSKFTNKEVDMEEFAKLDPRSPEYKEARKKLGLK